MKKVREEKITPIENKLKKILDEKMIEVSYSSPNALTGEPEQVILLEDVLAIIKDVTTPKIKIIGEKYDTKKQYRLWDENHKYPYYDVVDKKTFLLENTNTSEAQKWLLIHHPEYYFGCSIQEINYQKSCPDFILEPGPEYYERIYQTMDRDFIISKIKEELEITDELTQDQEERG